MTKDYKLFKAHSFRIILLGMCDFWLTINYNSGTYERLLSLGLLMVAYCLGFVFFFEIRLRKNEVKILYNSGFRS